MASAFVYGQNFETRLTLSPLMTFKSNKKTESKVDFGFLGSVQGFYKLTDHFAIGSGIGYSFENYRLTQVFEGIAIPESTSHYESRLTTHSLNLPFMLRLKSKSAWSINVGYGLTYAFDYSASVDYISSNWFVEDEKRSEISEKSVDSGKDLSGYYTIGLGKSFKINDLQLVTEVYYNYGHTDFRVDHEGRTGAEITYFYETRQYVGLKIGLGL